MAEQHPISLKQNIPGLKSQNRRHLHGPPEKGTAKSHGSSGNNTLSCSDKGVALASGGKGGAGLRLRGRQATGRFQERLQQRLLAVGERLP